MVSTLVTRLESHNPCSIRVRTLCRASHHSNPQRNLLVDLFDRSDRPMPSIAVHCHWLTDVNPPTAIHGFVSQHAEAEEGSKEMQ